MPKLPYLPVWDGKDRPSRRDGAGRYQAIATYLRENPIGDGTGFTVFDFGAFNGYFSRRLAEDFDARCTAVDDNPALTPYPGVEAINRRITPTDIGGPYDVVIAMSVLHHLEDWRDYLNALIEAGTVVFIEVAHPDENLPKAKAHHTSRAINRAVKAKKLGGQIIAETPGYDPRCVRPLVVIDRRNDTPTDDTTS